MDEKYNTLGPNSTLTELVLMAAKELIENDLNALDFDIPGTAPDGSPIVLHFEATIQKAGTC